MGPFLRFAFFEKSTFIDQITNAVQMEEPLQLVPSDRNFLAFSSILYDPNDPNAVAYLYSNHGELETRYFCLGSSAY